MASCLHIHVHRTVPTYDDLGLALTSVSFYADAKVNMESLRVPFLAHPSHPHSFIFDHEKNHVSSFNGN